MRMSSNGKSRHWHQGDVLLAISTSGNSKKLHQGAQNSRAPWASIRWLLGNDGGVMKALSDITFIVPSRSP